VVSVQASSEPLTTVSSLTERDLITRLQQSLPARPDWLIVGIGDDAAVVEPERNRAEVLTIDSIVEGVHFDRAFVPPTAIGHRALAVNLSDMAAMGASPRLGLLSLALPATLPLDDFDGLVTGLVELAGRTRTHVIGGNLTRSRGPLLIDVALAGAVKRRQALRRGGARPGDDIYVSGTVGAAAAGLDMLRSGTAPPGSETTGHTLANDTCVRRYLYPEPRLRLGLLLARNRAATAAIDLSDGLADSVHRVAEASGVGALIEADAVPVDPSARSWFAQRGLDPLSTALAAGDDYELLFTVRPRMGRRLDAARRHGGVPLTRIGRCTADRAVLLQDAGGTRQLPRVGYDHFRRPAAPE
jgi:thiamine-monophosphate kinase